MYLTNFIFKIFFLYIASYQLLKNGAILINHGSFFQGKDSLQLDSFQFLKMNQLLLNSAICLQKFCFEKLFFIISAIKEFIFKNRKWSSCRESSLCKNDP